MASGKMTKTEVEETAKTTRRTLSAVFSDRIDELVEDGIERIERDKKAAEPAIKELNVWLRWEIDPKTKQRKALLGVHRSLRSAQLALPKEFQELAMKYPADSPYVLNFLNKAIERKVLDD